MNEPAHEYYAAWISAYHDGELRDAQRAEMETHLEHCDACQEELATLRALDGLLRLELHDSTTPAHDPPLSDQEFARQLVNRLPAPQPSGFRSSLRTIWRFAPLSLFAAWALLQAVTWVSGLALIGSPVLLDSEGALINLLMLDLAQWLSVPLLGPAVDAVPGTALPLAVLAALNLWVTLNMALLMGGWLAGWIAYHRRQSLAPERVSTSL